MKKSINPSYVPVFLAALGQGVMWVGVFSLIHSGPMAYIGGIPVGLAIVWIIVRSANVLPRVQSKRARGAGWVFLALVLVCEPVVLGIVNWWYMPAAFQALFASYIVAGGASLVVSLVLVMGALVDRSLVAVETTSNVSATSETKPKRGKKTETQVAQPETAVTQPVATVSTVAKKPITDAELVSFFTGNPNATNAEAARHFKVSHTAIGKRSKKLFGVKHEVQTEQVKSS